MSASVRGALTKTDQLSRSLQIRAFSPAKMLSEDARPDGCCLDSVQSRAPRYATASALAKEPGATECMSHGHLAHQSDAQLFAYADPLAQYDSVSPGCLYWPSDHEKECYDRCIKHGLGSCMRWQTSLRDMVRNGESWHINCLELRAVHLALECFLPDILHRHVLIRADSMTVVAFINHQGCVNSQPLLRLARDPPSVADRHLLSIRAVHVPGRLNCGVDLLSRGGVIHRE